ncbi:hypothetical protein [Wolbachia endosymbiont of Tetranychus urticae]|uniref:hypothetical protein n=1 Tax=Wolbachia endosymbiont of Tetranychus urticae TaxID=169184 RepID=UPI00397DB090
MTECEELKGLDINEIFNFYRQGKTREFMESIEERVDNSQWFFYWLKEVTGDAFYKMIEGKVKFEQSVSSCIGGVRCDSLVSGISR